MSILTIIAFLSAMTVIVIRIKNRRMIIYRNMRVGTLEQGFLSTNKYSHIYTDKDLCTIFNEAKMKEMCVIVPKDKFKEMCVIVSEDEIN